MREAAGSQRRVALQPTPQLRLFQGQVQTDHFQRNAQVFRLFVVRKIMLLGQLWVCSLFNEMSFIAMRVLRGSSMFARSLELIFEVCRRERWPVVAQEDSFAY